MNDTINPSAKKILIVEDDYFISDIYKRVFTKAGYIVESALDGEIAINTVKDKTFDIILLDIMLPKVTGINVLKEFRKPESKVLHTPVFLITNLGQEAIIKEAFKIGADGYLLKAQLAPQDIVAEINNFFIKKSQPENVSQ